MNLKELKIGYVPYLEDLSQPGDRRRFPFFAQRKNIPFEVADINKQYDIILLTALGDLSKWFIYKKKNPKTKFIFEMTDSLILTSDPFRTLFKGVGRFLLGKESFLYFNYKTPIIKWLKIADVAVCSSTKMEMILRKWNNNVVVSLDYMQNEVKATKTDYQIRGKMKLVWEGQSVGLIHLLAFRDVLKQVNSFCELHVITDEQFQDYGNILKKEVTDLLRELPISTIFHKWELYKNYEILSSCDCGIITLNKNNRMAWHKPANKLISFWFTSLPTLVSDTPAYVELMDEANSKMYCGSKDEWVLKIKELMNMSAEERKEIAGKNFEFVKKNYSNEAISDNWKAIFDSLMEV